MTIRETERFELFFCPFGKAYRVMDNYTTSVSSLLTAADTWEEAEIVKNYPEDAFDEWCGEQLFNPR